MRLNKDQRKILEVLNSVYPNYMTIDDIINKSGIPQPNVEREMAYLEEEGMVDILREIGTRFKQARITSSGINALEN